MDKVRTRYAPSPTGFAHIGNIRTAIFDWFLVRRYGGEFILRIEDTDRARLVEGSIEEIIESLRWLGIQWDEGPDVGGPHGPYTQSERREMYERYARQLVEQGHAYHCFCTSDRLAEMRKGQEARKEPTGYDRACLSLSPEEVAARLAKGEPSVIRFKVPTEGVTTFTDMIRGEISFENRLLDDFVIYKSDGYPTYHLASVIDDHDMEITHVIRAEEWISSTPKHMLLYKAFGWDAPSFVHPPLILGPDKSKLSKRHGAVRFLDYKERGFLPETMLNYVALLGWSSGTDQELFSIQEIIEKFSIEGIVNHPVVFDIQKLEWMNGVYIRESSVERITELAMPFMRSAGLIPAVSTDEELDYARRVIALEKDKLKVLSQAPELTSFFFEDEPPYDEKGTTKWLKRDHAPQLLRRLLEEFTGMESLTVSAVEETVRRVGEEMGLSGGPVVHPVRMAVTGRTVGPGLFETIEVLGRDKVLARLQRTVYLLENGKL